MSFQDSDIFWHRLWQARLGCGTKAASASKGSGFRGLAQFAIENGHRNSWFMLIYPLKLGWFSTMMLVYQRVIVDEYWMNIGWILDEYWLMNTVELSCSHVRSWNCPESETLPHLSSLLRMRVTPDSKRQADPSCRNFGKLTLAPRWIRMMAPATLKIAKFD